MIRPFPCPLQHLVPLSDSKRGGATVARASESKTDGFALQPALHGTSLLVLPPATGLPGSFGQLFILGLDGIPPEPGVGRRKASG